MITVKVIIPFNDALNNAVWREKDEEFSVERDRADYLIGKGKVIELNSDAVSDNTTTTRNRTRKAETDYVQTY